MSSRLDLFGTIHIDRRSKVEAELTEYLEAADAEAVFVEKPSEEDTRRTFVGAALRAPIGYLGVLLVGLIQSTLYAVFNQRLLASEHVVTDQLADEYAIHEVDRSILSLMANSGFVSILLNWIVLAGFLLWIPAQTIATVVAVAVGGFAVSLTMYRSRRLATAVGVCGTAGLVVLRGHTMLLSGWVLLALGVGFIVLALRTIAPRNRHMVERITAITDEEGYDSGMLVVGRGHLPGLVKLTAESDLVLSRTYVPKLYRAPGKVDENPAVDSDEAEAEAQEKQPLRPGSLGRRTAATLIDFVALLVLLWVPGLGLAAVTEAVLGGVLSGFVAGVALTPLVYYVGLEAAFGRTLGKRLTRLVVTDDDGSRASFWACLLRNLVRPVDFLIFYFVGFVTMALTRRHQRLGDLLAGTEVRLIE